MTIFKLSELQILEIWKSTKIKMVCDLVSSSYTKCWSPYLHPANFCIDQCNAMWILDGMGMLRKRIRRTHIYLCLDYSLIQRSNRYPHTISLSSHHRLCNGLCHWRGRVSFCNKKYWLSKRVRGKKKMKSHWTGKIRVSQINKELY